MKQVPGLIFVITGPSGSGKTTLLKNLLKVQGLKNRLSKSISFTTRPKRPGEKNKKDYFFISEREFKHKQKKEKILEWTRYLGYYYATPKDFIEQHLENGKNVILCLDLKGALKIKRLYPKNTITIFIMPPSLEALQERIKKRSHKVNKEEVRLRTILAKKELKAQGSYDYCVVNKDLGLAAKELKDIILNKINT